MNAEDHRLDVSDDPVVATCYGFMLMSEITAMRTYELKVKIKSLAEEARIIRKEEKSLPGDSHHRTNLHNHRVVDVRREARASQLAYAYMRGTAYLRVEQTCKREPNWERVENVAKRFIGSDFDQDAFEAWRKEEVDPGRVAAQ